MANEAKTIVLALGQQPKMPRSRGQNLIELLQHHSGFSYLLLSQDGKPSHPLYLSSQDSDS